MESISSTFEMKVLTKNNKRVIFNGYLELSEVRYVVWKPLSQMCFSIFLEVANTNQVADWSDPDPRSTEKLAADAPQCWLKLSWLYFRNVFQKGKATRG